MDAIEMVRSAELTAKETVRLEGERAAQLLEQAKTEALCTTQEMLDKAYNEANEAMLRAQKENAAHMESAAASIDAEVNALRANVLLRQPAAIREILSALV